MENKKDITSQGTDVLELPIAAALGDLDTHDFDKHSLCLDSAPLAGLPDVPPLAEFARGSGSFEPRHPKHHGTAWRTVFRAVYANIDTNVIVSAPLKPEGMLEGVTAACAAAHTSLCRRATASRSPLYKVVSVTTS